MSLASIVRWAWLKTTVALSALISHLVRDLDIDALPDSSIVLSEVGVFSQAQRTTSAKLESVYMR